MHARGYLIDDFQFQTLASLKLTLSDGIRGRLKNRLPQIIDTAAHQSKGYLKTNKVSFCEAKIIRSSSN